MATIKIQSREKTLGATKLSLIAADENGNALSVGKFQYTTTSYCDTSVKTMLAQGIETPVEHRRGGNVRNMFQFMHAAAVEEGMAVALLHPFSFTYYNKFGYEKVASHLILRFPTRMIDFVPRGCNFIPYEVSMLPDLISIYQAFSKGRNLLLPRVDGEKYQGKTIYVCYDGGTPIAYVILSEHKELYVNNYRNTLLTVNEMAYVSPKGLREIFSFLRMFEGEFDEIELLDGGLYSEVDLLLRHYVHTKYTSIADLSAKLLNTEAMLLANTYPQKEGAFTVKITDELPTVAGVYRVSYGGGDCQVKRLDDTAQSDILLPSNVFTRLIYGNDPIDERNVRYFDGVEIYGNTEDLFRAFPKRPCGAFEHF